MVEGAHRSFESLERHRPGNIGNDAGLQRVVDGQATNRSHVLSAIQEGQTLFGLELEGG